MAVDTGDKMVEALSLTSSSVSRNLLKEIYQSLHFKKNHLHHILGRISDDLR